MKEKENLLGQKAATACSSLCEESWRQRRETFLCCYLFPLLE